jgi:hypothetical protein
MESNLPEHSGEQPDTSNDPVRFLKLDPNVPCKLRRI